MPLRSRRILIVVGAVVVSALAARLIIGHIYPGEGPYISLSANHGIHLADLVVVAVWALVMRVFWRAWRAPAPGSAPGSAAGSGPQASEVEKGKERGRDDG